MISPSGYLVKPEAAQNQIDEEIRKAEEKAQRKAAVDAAIVQPHNLETDIPFGIGSAEPPEDVEIQTPPAPSTPSPASSVKQPHLNTRFFMSAKLDNTRTNRDVQKLVEEIISHLTDLEGCDVDLHLEVSAAYPDGFSVPIVRAISENCNTLKVDTFGFE